MTAQSLLIKVPVLKSQDPLDKAITLLEQTTVHVIPILDDKEELVGILTKTDIFQFLSRPGHYLSCPIEWLMSKKVLTANPDSTLKEIVALLRKNDIFSLPIVENNRFVGLVTIESILDYLMEHVVE